MINIFHFVIKRYFYLQKTDIGIQLNTNKAVYIYIVLVFAHKKRATYWLLFLILIYPSDFNMHDSERGH
ncbi:hypothetical protein C0W88_00960 [Photobacterium leiognathi subsp. mandapamensis]|nr:hypothetical protein C0W88_00960 [Photobacterium leiognathi subsp. mandapamensis]